MEEVERRWTEARVGTMKVMWAEGGSASEIAAALGDGFTRNAVLGKLHRMKLVGQRKPAKAKALRATPTRRVQRTVKGKSLAQRSEERAQQTADAEATQALRGAAWRPLRHTVPVVVEKHRDAQCRWPIGDPLEPGFGFCGCAALEGKPYCEQHARLSVASLVPQKVRTPAGIGQLRTHLRPEAA